MRDPRIDQLARLMLRHSMHITKGEAFHITSDIAAIPLVKAILAEAAKIGALAQVDLTSQEISRGLLEMYDPDDGGTTAAFLADKAQTGIRQYEHLVGDIVIRGIQNDQELAGIPPAVLQLSAKQGKPLKDLLVDSRRWVLFDYPTFGQAQRLGKIGRAHV